MATSGFEVTGVAPFLAKLHELSDPRKLERTTRESMGRSGKKVIAPRMAQSSGWKYGGHGGEHPTKGILGKRSAITARKVRTRQGEYVAVSVKFRGWPGRVAAWTVQGTKPHVIRPREARALAFGGRLAWSVQHPGAKPTPFVYDAVQGTERLVMAALEADLFRQMDRAARGKK